MLITIITSTLNCRDSFCLTAASIESQIDAEYQWIVIDGGSTDGTLDVIEKYRSIIDYFVSERDRGIYDAWNKACKKISGDWVIFLGGGDIFLNNETLARVSSILQTMNETVSYAYGNVVLRRKGKRVMISGHINNDEWDLYRPKLPCHQGVFQRSKYLKIDQPFDDSYMIVADSKFLLKIRELGEQAYIPMDITMMATGGVSQSPRHVKQVRDEFLRLEKESGYKIPIANKIFFHAYVYLKNFFGSIGMLK